MTDWQRVRLDELALDEKSAISKPYGSAIVREDYRPSGVPVVRGVNLADGIFHDDDFVFISSALADQMPGASLRAGDLIFTHRGTVGQVSMVPRTPRYDRYTLSTSQVKARLDPGRALPEFYYYWFKSELGQRSIIEGISTVGVPGLAQPVATIKSLTVPKPALSAQQAIAEVLGALDDKIVVDSRLIVTIKDYLNARYRLAISADHDTTTVNSLAEFHNRRRVPLSAREREEHPGTVPYYGASGAFGNVDKPIFNEPLTLVGEDGSVITDRGHPVTQYIWGPSWVNNHAHVLTGRQISTELLSIILSQADARHLVTGAVQPKLSMGKLRTLTVSVPTRESLPHFEALCADQMALVRTLTEEARTLATLRDTLLPHLMSGRLRVKDAEKQVEAVV